MSLPQHSAQAAKSRSGIDREWLKMDYLWEEAFQPGQGSLLSDLAGLAAPSGRILGTNQRLAQLLGSLRELGDTRSSWENTRSSIQTLILLRFFSVRDFPEQRPIKLRPGEKEVQREKLLARSKWKQKAAQSLPSLWCN